MPSYRASSIFLLQIDFFPFFFFFLKSNFYFPEDEGILLIGNKEISLFLHINLTIKPFRGF